MRTGSWFVPKVGAVLLVLIAAILLFPAVIRLLTGLSMFLVSVLFLPALCVVLGWFVFSVWGKVYFRAWHIRRIRNARYLREAIERGRSDA